MKSLPKHFIIRRDTKNPLWQKYIKWLDEKYKNKLRGQSFDYYGFDWEENELFQDSLFDFKNNPTLITLKHWNQCVNGKPKKLKWSDFEGTIDIKKGVFVPKAPKYWYIITEEMEKSGYWELFKEWFIKKRRNRDFSATRYGFCEGYCLREDYYSYVTSYEAKKMPQLSPQQWYDLIYDGEKQKQYSAIIFNEWTEETMKELEWTFKPKPMKTYEPWDFYEGWDKLKPLLSRKGINIGDLFVVVLNKNNHNFKIGEVVMNKSYSHYGNYTDWWALSYFELAKLPTEEKKEKTRNRHTYTKNPTTYTRDDGVVFQSESINGTPIEDLKQQMRDHRQKANDIQALLSAQHNLKF